MIHYINILLMLWQKKTPLHVASNFNLHRFIALGTPFFFSKKQGDKVNIKLSKIIESLITLLYL